MVMLKNIQRYFKMSSPVARQEMAKIIWDDFCFCVRRPFRVWFGYYRLLKKNNWDFTATKAETISNYHKARLLNWKLQSALDEILELIKKAKESTDPKVIAYRDKIERGKINSTFKEKQNENTS